MVQLPVKILGAASLKSQPFKPLCSLAKGWRATGKTAAATVHCTLLVLIDFCPVYGELFTWSSVDKTFAILPANISDIL